MFLLKGCRYTSSQCTLVVLITTACAHGCLFLQSDWHLLVLTHLHQLDPRNIMCIVCVCQCCCIFVPWCDVIICPFPLHRKTLIIRCTLQTNDINQGNQWFVFPEMWCFVDNNDQQWLFKCYNRSVVWIIWGTSVRIFPGHAGGRAYDAGRLATTWLRPWWSIGCWFNRDMMKIYGNISI